MERRFGKTLASSGAVILGARRTELLPELVALIEAEGGKAIAVPLDVAEEKSVIAAFDAAEGSFGPADHAAGASS